MSLVIFQNLSFSLMPTSILVVREISWLVLSVSMVYRQDRGMQTDPNKCRHVLCIIEYKLHTNCYRTISKISHDMCMFVSIHFSQKYYIDIISMHASFCFSHDLNSICTFRWAIHGFWALSFERVYYYFDLLWVSSVAFIILNAIVCNRHWDINISNQKQTYQPLFKPQFEKNSHKATIIFELLLNRTSQTYKTTLPDS